MATKYHISPDGPRPCTATLRDCPVGGAHFEGPIGLAEAHFIYDKQLTEEYGALPSLSKKGAKQTRPLGTPTNYDPHLLRDYDDSLYRERNLEGALEEAHGYVAEGKFVVIREWHEEQQELLGGFEDTDTPMFTHDQETDGFMSTADEALPLFMQDEEELQLGDVNEVVVTYSAQAFESREDFESFVEANPDYFQGSNNAITSLSKAEDFDGYESDTDEDPYNAGRTFHSAVRVFYDNGVEGNPAATDPTKATRRPLGRDFTGLAVSARLTMLDGYKLAYDRATTEASKTMHADLALEVAESVLKEKPNQKIQEAASAYAADRTPAARDYFMRHFQLKR